MKNLQEIEVREAEIRELVNADETNETKLTSEQIESLTSELESLKTERAAITEKAEKRQALINAALAGKGKTVEERHEDKPMETKFNLESPEFRSAYFKTLAGEQLNDIEQRAFIDTTATFGGALPVTTANEIWSNIEEEHPILGDITLYRTGTVFELTVHSAIAAGDAAVTAQGAAPTEEENTWVKVTLSGKDFAKSIDISYALGMMASAALESYLVREISERIGAALAADVIAEIVASTAAGNKKTSAAVKVTTYVELNSLFALIKAKGLVVYASPATIYNYLTSIVDTTGRPVFQPSAQAGIAGYLIGAPVKAEDACTANLFYIGAPKKIVGNMVQEIMVESAKDIKKHVITFAGFARFECKLTKDKAFVVFTVKQA